MTALGRVGATSLVAVVGVVVLVACGSSETDPWEERWALLGIPEAEFVFLGDWTDEEQESIRWELKRVQVVFAEHFGAVTSDFTVYVSAELDRPEVRRLGRTCGGGSWDRRVIRIVLEGCSEGYRARGGPLAREYFHVLQRKAGTISTASGAPGRWMVEGAAVYAQAIYDDLTGRRPLAAQRELERLSWSASGTSAPHLGDPSEVGFIVTERLVEQTGPEAILEFFRLGGHRAAFTQAFGVDYDVFAAAIEVHRLQVAAPFEWRVAGTVFDSAGQPAAGLDIFAVVRIEGKSRAVGSGETDTQGEFGFATPGTGYTIAVFLQCHRDDGAVKWVHVGELGEEGFVADEDGTWNHREEGAEPFADGDRDRTNLVIEIPETRESLIAKHCQQ
ncbi:MAG: carboxypeptidase regulatory-like domain-containing protein [Dehalococcoidia bacterium]|nr:carboxypeptidase regulatory-like domain-containing protein [Dehalococcoidia bacterium]